MQEVSKEREFLMASLREIRRKIKSVKSTQQITKAMKTCPHGVSRAGPPVVRWVGAAQLLQVQL